MTKLLTATLLFITIGLTAMAASGKDSSFIETSITLHTPTGDIFGTLTFPKDLTAMPVAFIIAGSGATDRNCNGPMLKTEAYKKLAYELAKNNIASLRYDKRGIAESQPAGKNESDLRFDDYVNDARSWIELLKHDKRFTKVIVVGHSEGSLIGMIAAGSADKFISIAGAGQSADKILKTQLADQPEKIKDIAYSIIDSLVLGKTVKKIDPMLYALFRPSVQPYMISWFQYDPQVEIKKLNIPVMIIQGTNDIQVSVEDANLLAKASPQAELLIIENMNHIFRIIEGDDRDANIASYNNPSLPISNKLTTGIVEFIKQH